MRNDTDLPALDLDLQAKRYRMNKLNYDTTTLVAEILGKTVMWSIFWIVGFLSVYYGAFVLREMWEWFAVPAGFTMIDKRTSIGVFLIVGLLKTTMNMNSKTSDDEVPAYVKGITASLGYMIFFTLSWASAAIWHFWLL